MKFSIIGSGFIFPAHAEAIRHIGGKIRHVVNTAHGEDAWRKIIRETDAKYIVVLAPNDLHFPITMAALEAGKTVLCEKPLAINSKDVELLKDRSDVFTVLQLHFHPTIKKLEAEIIKNKNYDIEMDISVYRDPQYYLNWKGQKERSGGLLFNLGSHYFDILLHIFGEPTEVDTFSLDDKTGTGIIKGKNYVCRWRVSTDEKRDNQRRIFRIDGVNYNFSSQDNLSYENLHRFVYKDFIQGKGVLPREALKSIKLIESLCEAWENKKK